MPKWQDTPFRIEVKANDKISFCQCGKTQNPPYCDGSHAGSGIKPFRETFEEDKVIFICGCGNSKGKPYCDGSHKKLKIDQS